MLISISRRAHLRATSGQIDPRESLKTELVSDKSCAGYLPASLRSHDFEDGYIRLFFDADKAEWRVATRYLTGAALEPSQIDKLVELTLGQWSDGLGEGCFDEVAMAAGVSIDVFPWDADDTLHVDVDASTVPAKRSKPSKALYNAAEAGDLAKVKQLIEKGADLEFGDDGHTPLHIAILCGSLEIAQALLEAGANPKAVYEGVTGGPVDALMEAALSNSISDENAAAISRALLERGVDPNGERDGYTPLDMADVRAKYQMVEVLREYGATA